MLLVVIVLCCVILLVLFFRYDNDVGNRYSRCLNDEMWLANASRLGVLSWLLDLDLLLSLCGCLDELVSVGGKCMLSYLV